MRELDERSITDEVLRRFEGCGNPRLKAEWVYAIDFLTRSSELGPSANTLTHLGMALIASGEKDRARTILAHARDLGDQGQGLQERMMEFMKDSTRLLERVMRNQKK